MKNFPFRFSTLKKSKPRNKLDFDFLKRCESHHGVIHVSRQDALFFVVVYFFKLCIYNIIILSALFT
ncbi:hypothetical protein, partial [Streptococcus pneumoniae]|uniref:hypothetical protein n=1 Tax=Streptococcus pneumoniae TaxID=1313 RepID=UPI001C9BDC5C